MDGGIVTDGEVATQGRDAAPRETLEADLEALVRLSAALAAGDRAAMDGALRRASEVAPHRQVEEALLQSYLFLGYPAALNALARWREIAPESAAHLDDAPAATWPDRGASVCRVVYGGQYEGLRDNVRALHPEMEEWMVVEGYGKVLGRAGLPLVRRELCIVAILAVLDAPRQLYSHLRGALHAGARPSLVDETLEVALAEAAGARSAGPGDRADTARATWARLRARRGRARSESSS